MTFDIGERTGSPLYVRLSQTDQKYPDPSPY